MCKNFNVAHYSKSIKGINTKLGILTQQDKVQLQDKGHNSESYIFELCPFKLKFLSRKTSVGTACGALVHANYL